MRIAFVSYDFPEYCIRHANELAKTHDVLLAMPLDAESQLHKLVSPSVQFSRIDRPRYRQPIRQLKVARTILSQVHRFKPDVVHFQNGHPFFNIALRSLKKYPLVITIHDASQHPGDKEAAITPQWLMDYGFRLADRVIVHGQTVADEVISRHGFSSDKVHLIPHIAIGQSAEGLPSSDDGRTVLFFGRIWGYKGLDYLIRCEPYVTAEFPDVRFVIAGKGEDFDIYRKQMVNPDRFEVHNDWISDQQRAEFFAAASLVALPYTEASQSGVVPLAYLHKKAIVASRIGGLPDVVDHETTGLLVEPKNERELAAAIVRLLRAPALRQSMGQAGRAKLDAECSPPAVVAKTEDVYAISTGQTHTHDAGKRYRNAAARTHRFLQDTLQDGVLTGPDPGVRFNYRIWRFLKSISPEKDWGDNCTYLQTQGYWILANWRLHDSSSQVDSSDQLAIAASDGIIDLQNADGSWSYPNAEWAGRVATVEGVWASLGLLETYRQTGEHRYLRSVLSWHDFFIDRIGFQELADTRLAVNYFADEESPKVPNNSALALRYLAELSRTTEDDSFLAHASGLMAFIAAAQLPTGELPYVYQHPKMTHFQCFQYQAFTLIDLLHYYRITNDELVLEVLQRQVEFLQTGLTSNSEALYECGNLHRFVNYHSAAVGTALVLAGNLLEDETLKHTGKAALDSLLSRQNDDGSWSHSRGDYRVLSDRRKYPRYLSMILLHLVSAADDTPGRNFASAANSLAEVQS